MSMTNMSLISLYKEMLSTLENAKKDVQSFIEKENGAAGRRARLAMKSVKEMAHEFRKKVQEIKNQKKASE